MMRQSNTIVVELGFDKNPMDFLLEREIISPERKNDIVFYKRKLLSIEDVRNLKQIYTQKSLLLVLQVLSIKNEAQNAMLKMTEEMPENSFFALCIPSRSILIDTLLSRLEFVNAATIKDDGVDEFAAEFVKKDVQSRLSVIEKMKQGDEFQIKFLTMLDSLLDFFTKDIEKNSGKINILLKLRKRVLSGLPLRKSQLELVAFIDFLD